MDIKLNDIVQNIIEEKFNNGEITNLLSNAIDKALNDVVNDLFTSYNSPLKKQLEEKLNPIVSTAIANGNIDGITEKLTILINENINNSEIGRITDMANRYNALSSVLGEKTKTKFGDKINLSTIFGEYKKWIESEAESLSYNDDDWDYDEGYEYVEWNVELHAIDYYEDEYNKPHYYGNKDKDKRYRLSARPEETDIIDEDDYNFDIDFVIHTNYSGEKVLMIDNNLSINDLIHAPKFILNLYSISSYYRPIIIDKDSFCDSVEVKIERQE